MQAHIPDNLFTSSFPTVYPGHCLIVIT
jgi:hypothetical protein